MCCLPHNSLYTFVITHTVISVTTGKLTLKTPEIDTMRNLASEKSAKWL